MPMLESRYRLVPESFHILRCRSRGRHCRGEILLQQQEYLLRTVPTDRQPKVEGENDLVALEIPWWFRGILLKIALCKNMGLFAFRKFITIPLGRSKSTVITSFMVPCYVPGTLWLLFQTKIG